MPIESNTTTIATTRLAVAQTTQRTAPDDVAGFRAAGEEIRALMRQASADGARLAQFPEATLCFPSKVALSSRPDEVAESDWTRYAWHEQQLQLDAVARTARELRLWTVIGAPHRIVPDDRSRPTLSLHVIDDRGRRVGRYDERLLSRTKRSFMYRAGDRSLTFEVDGVRFGCTSGLEVLFPELFADYEADGVDCVLYSSAGPAEVAEADTLASSARTAAHQNGLWVGYSVPAHNAPWAAAGILRPGGEWEARCAGTPEPAIAIAEIGSRPETPGREWRRDQLLAHRAAASAG